MSNGRGGAVPEQGLCCQNVNCFSKTSAILHVANNAVVSSQKDGDKESAYPFVIVFEVAV